MEFQLKLMIVSFWCTLVIIMGFYIFRIRKTMEDIEIGFVIGGLFGSFAVVIIYYTLTLLTGV